MTSEHEIDTEQANAEVQGAPSLRVDYLKGYRWPASRLTTSDMRKLTIIRNQTGRSITKLLHDAVEALWSARSNGDSKTGEQNGQAGG